MLYSYFYHSPIGWINIKTTDSSVHSIQYLDEPFSFDDSNETHPFLMIVKKQLDEYFKGLRKDFTLPFHIDGSLFQQTVLHQVQYIPYGTTCSYKQIATQIHNPKASRAVGNANNKNQLLIFIPCHRVIGNNGDLVGYAAGLWRKEWLLQHERQNY